VRAEVALERLKGVVNAVAATTTDLGA